MSVHIFCCTERQAANLGRFLNASLGILQHWKSNENVYKEECAKLPGFSVSFTTGDGKKASYEDYVKVVFKWCDLAACATRCIHCNHACLSWCRQLN